MNKLIYLLILSSVVISSDAYVIDVKSQEAEIGRDNSKVTVIETDIEEEIIGSSNTEILNIEHDPNNGIYHNDSKGSDGLVLKGVNKNDLELLHHGQMMYEDMQ